MTASIPLRHFLRRVSMFRLLVGFFNDPTILLNTMLTIPASRAVRWFASDAYPPSVVISRGTTP